MALYLFGDEVTPEDRLQAEKWMRKSSNPDVLKLLPSLFFVEDYGVPDIKKSISLGLEVESLINGEPRLFVQRILVAAYAQIGDLDESIYWLYRLVAAKDASSQLLLGLYMQTGAGSLEKDTSEGWRLMISAAENGNADAQFIIGIAHLIGSADLDFGPIFRLTKKRASSGS